MALIIIYLIIATFSFTKSMNNLSLRDKCKFIGPGETCNEWAKSFIENCPEGYSCTGPLGVPKGLRMAKKTIIFIKSPLTILPGVDFKEW